MCIEMFHRDKIDLIYRLLCLFAFMLTIIFVDSFISLFIIMLLFIVFSFTENRFENYFLYILTTLVLLFCLSMKSYFLFRIVLIIDYVHYCLNVDTLRDFDEDDFEEERNQEYIRFKKEKEERKNNNLLCTVFVTVHLVILLLAVVIG